ncbi:hypothetical protein [Aliarcobacter cibarius]|uniref:Uncharacterized protein n=1 Tax=Aliarcobacter cibarius TaxID=255507 RepID=A0ABY2V6E6_9BACT|nr:hypothetical protein [Aliarcobacter cibarius]TLT01325.1 hypothetical protein FE247_02255 [Aliarcobacter cibarius]TLT01730.1 hypothetical protein FE245_02255 [Aliarcobacter cibarius]
MMEYLTFSNIASTASIISLGISIWVLILVRNIKTKFLFRVNIDSNATKIKKISSELVSLLGDFVNNKDEIEEKLKIIEVVVKNLNKGTDNQDLSKTFNSVTNRISKYFNSEDINRNEKDVRGIRHQVVSIVEELNFEKQSIKVGN